MINYRTATKNQLLQEFDRLKKITGDSGFFTKKEFLHFPKVVIDNEEPLALCSGSMENKTWLIILTNKRVIFLDKGFLFGLKQIAVDLKKIAEVSGATALISGTISISTTGMSYTVKNVSKNTVIPFTNLIKNAMESLENNTIQNHHAPVKKDDDLINKLERLAHLKEKGIITEEEFKTQKEKILIEN